MTSIFFLLVDKYLLKKIGGRDKNLVFSCRTDSKNYWWPNVGIINLCGGSSDLKSVLRCCQLDTFTMPSLKNVPQSVKFVQPIINRALELESVEPIISYYCKLHAVQDIIAKGTHLADDEAATFAGTLLDDIEKVKTGNPVVSSEEGASIISDDVTGQAYVDNFANKIFTKADAEVREKRTTKATMATFMAAATFLDLLRLFGDLDADVTQKIKYAKFHATRIMKAYRGGEDPNDYEAEEEVSKDEVDEVILEVTKADDDNAEMDSTVQPISPPPHLSQSAADLPHPPSIPVLPSAPPILPSAPDSLPGSVPDFPKPPSNDVSFPEIPKGFADPSSTLPPAATIAPRVNPVAPTQVHQRSTISQIDPRTQTTGPTLSKDEIRKIVDESEILAAAQKHAKYAISALNYEDKATAVNELTKALELLTTKQ
jgi:vacuolar protein sorting-associated protein VTA1